MHCIPSIACHPSPEKRLFVELSCDIHNMKNGDLPRQARDKHERKFETKTAICFLTSEAKAHAAVAEAAGLRKLVLAKVVLQVRAAPAGRERWAGEERDRETVGTFHHPESVFDAVAVRENGSLF
jgi:hypothetical protein